MKIGIKAEHLNAPTVAENRRKIHLNVFIAIIRFKTGKLNILFGGGLIYFMKTREEALKYGLSFPDTYQEAPFHDPNWQLVRYKYNKKAFLWTYEREGFINLNVKVDPETAFFWRKAYSSVIPGYHRNKEHWNTIILDGSIPDKDIKLMIAESYDLIADSPTKRIYDAVARIPKGCVATYAQVAEEAGDRKMARAVGNALHKISSESN